MCRIRDFCEALVTKVGHKFLEFFTNHRTQSIRVAKNVEQICNFSDFIGVFLQ